MSARVQYRGRIGHIYGEERVSPEHAREAALDALADYPYEFPERYEEPVIERREVTDWEEVTDV